MRVIILLFVYILSGNIYANKKHDLCECEGKYFEIGEKSLDGLPKWTYGNGYTQVEHHQLIECSSGKITGSAGFAYKEDGLSLPSFFNVIKKSGNGVIFENATIRGDEYKPSTNYSGTLGYPRRFIHSNIMWDVINSYVDPNEIQCSVDPSSKKRSEIKANKDYQAGFICQDFVRKSIKEYDKKISECKGTLGKKILKYKLNSKLIDLQKDLSDIVVEDKGKGVGKSFVCLVQKKYIHTNGSRSGYNSYGCLKNNKQIVSDKEKWIENIKRKISKVTNKLKKINIPSHCQIDNNIPLTECGSTAWKKEVESIHMKIKDLQLSISSAGFINEKNCSSNVIPYYNVYKNGAFKGKNKMGCSSELELNGAIGKMKIKIDILKIKLEAYEYYSKRCGRC